MITSCELVVPKQNDQEANKGGRMQKSSIFKAWTFEIAIIGAVKTTYSGPPADNVKIHGVG